MAGIPSFLTPGLGNRFQDWIQVWRQSGERVSPSLAHRALIVGGICLLSAPFQHYESLRLRRRLADTPIHPAPVFIIGHWRSGTTLMHNLLSQDPQFGYVSTVQSLFPHSFLTNPLFPWLTRVLMPDTRPMDNMRLFVDSPQEEEMALVNYGPWSLYHGWHFPRALRSYYRRLVAFEGLDMPGRQAWRRAYLDLLRKATLHAGGRRLVLKNPPHTARLPELLHLFPEARFIFLHRDPYAVFPSMQKLYRNVLPVFQLQDLDPGALDEDIIWIYRRLLTTYLEDRGQVPAGRIREVMFSELVDQPMAILRAVYQQLELGPFERVSKRMRDYLDQRRVSTYRPAGYKLSEGTRERLANEWAFAWEAWPGE